MPEVEFHLHNGSSIKPPPPSCHSDCDIFRPRALIFRTIAVDTPSHNDPGAVDLTKFAGSSTITARYNGLNADVPISKKPTALCDGNLHHLALVRDAEANEIHLYFDHELLERIEGLHGSRNAHENPRNPRFMAGGAPYNKERWNGLISEVRITKRALIPAQFLPKPNP